MAKQGRPFVSDAMKWQPVLRGYPFDYEVLTELGWLGFEALFQAGIRGTVNSPAPLFDGEVDWTVEHVPLRDNWEARFDKRYLNREVYIKESFLKYRVGSDFPRVATLEAGNIIKSGADGGKLEWVRPEFFTFFNYPATRSLVAIRQRGVHLTVPWFTDLFVKPKYQNIWRFIPAESGAGIPDTIPMSYGMINKWSPKGVLFGFIDGQKIREAVDNKEVSALLVMEEPIKLWVKNMSFMTVAKAYPTDPIRSETSGRFVENPIQREYLDCFNMILPVGTSHTLIVRQKGKEGSPNFPSTTWKGSPIVVGDGYDKTLIQRDRLAGAYSSVLG